MNQAHGGAAHCQAVCLLLVYVFMCFHFLLNVTSRSDLWFRSVCGVCLCVVCAMPCARCGRGFEPRFVCSSRGPSVRPPPPPPSASRSTIDTAGASGGVSPPSFFQPPAPTPAPPTHTKTRHQARHTYSSAPCHCYRRPRGGACPPRIPPPLACGRGLELGSSGQQPAAEPLHHTARSPAALPSLHPSCLPCPECFSLCVCVAAWWHPAHDKSRRRRR